MTFSSLLATRQVPAGWYYVSLASLPLSYWVYFRGYENIFEISDQSICSFMMMSLLECVLQGHLLLTSINFNYGMENNDIHYKV